MAVCSLYSNSPHSHQLPNWFLKIRNLTKIFEQCFQRVKSMRRTIKAVDVSAILAKWTIAHLSPRQFFQHFCCSLKSLTNSSYRHGYMITQRINLLTATQNIIHFNSPQSCVISKVPWLKSRKIKLFFSTWTSTCLNRASAWVFFFIKSKDEVFCHQDGRHVKILWVRLILVCDNDLLYKGNLQWLRGWMIEGSLLRMISFLKKKKSTH